MNQNQRTAIELPLFADCENFFADCRVNLYLRMLAAHHHPVLAGVALQKMFLVVGGELVIIRPEIVIACQQPPIPETHQPDLAATCDKICNPAHRRQARRTHVAVVNERLAGMPFFEFQRRRNRANDVAHAGKPRKDDRTFSRADNHRQNHNDDIPGRLQMPFCQRKQIF